MAWTTSADVRARLQRQWERGRILAARLHGTALFPMSLPFPRPDARALAERFDEVRQWIRELEAHSRAQLGYGYDIGWTEVNHRSLGRNRVPISLTIATEDDALRLIGKTREASQFQRRAEATLASFPILHAWIAKHPLALIEHGNAWERVLGVLAWFREHPRPNLYLRQLDIAGVDTKFIETNRGLLAELLDQVLPENMVDRKSPAREFERRYGLLSKPDLMRLRILDPRYRLSGFSDLTVRTDELATIDLPVKRFFITENEINGLAFPSSPDSVVIFGLGYSVDRLVEVPWLRGRAIVYWGDIDTHGFAILSRLRTIWPQTQSLLMDRETLMAHQSLWVTEPKQAPPPLSRLTIHEQQLFDDLFGQRLGDNVRLEQERISFGHVIAAINLLRSP